MITSGRLKTAFFWGGKERGGGGVLETAYLEASVIAMKFHFLSSP